MVLGGLLALYDGAEVLLKPVFGTLADRVGARPVLLEGLSPSPPPPPYTRWRTAPAGCGRRVLGQGAAASAFSPRPPRWSPGSTRRRGAAGPSAVTVSTSPSATPSARCSVGCWCGPGAAAAVHGAGGARRGGGVVGRARRPRRTPLPKARQTVLDLARRLTHPDFLRPTAALAAATAALSVGVGFLPVSGRAAGLGTVATGVAVSVLAACAAIVQPRAGRALDGGRLTARGASPQGC